MLSPGDIVLVGSELGEYHTSFDPVPGLVVGVSTRGPLYSVLVEGRLRTVHERWLYRMPQK